MGEQQLSIYAEYVERDLKSEVAERGRQGKHFSQLESTWVVS